MSVKNIIADLKANSNPERAEFSKRYFPPELGQKMDIFFGGTVPSTRQVAKKYIQSDFTIIQELLQSDIHEVKLCGLMILGLQLKKAIKVKDIKSINNIKQFYLDNNKAADHWDLVDESSNIVTDSILFFLTDEELYNYTDFQDTNKNFQDLVDLAKQDSIWAKRISIISQFSVIKRGNLLLPLSICQFHINHQHHYVQKAVGWVLREIGKYDRRLLDKFLLKNIKIIGSICLSYALEKHTKEERAKIRSRR
jgi:3-methyladenine DNA glycosylase AlkD